MRKAAVVALICVVAAALCGAPQTVLARDSIAQQKEKKEKKEKKITKKQIKADNKDKQKSKPTPEVNRINDGFKKSGESIKNGAASLRKSINDAWEKSKEPVK